MDETTNQAKPQPSPPPAAASPSPPTTDQAPSPAPALSPAADAALAQVPAELKRSPEEVAALQAEASAVAAKEAQRQQLLFFAGIAEGEQRLVAAALAFFEGLPETHMLGQRSEAARLQAIEAARTLHPMLGIAVTAMKAQADAA